MTLSKSEWYQYGRRVFFQEVVEEVAALEMRCGEHGISEDPNLAPVM